jgi:hypothetical protein
MFSVQPGVYEAKGQPEIIVTYGGEIASDPDHTGPWIQWRFPWDAENQFTTTIWYEFEALLKYADYKLKEAQPSLGFRS